MAKSSWAYKQAERARAEAAAEHRAQREIVPPGWTAEAWRCYADDPDGGRAPFRLMPPDTTPCIAEILSREA